MVGFFHTRHSRKIDVAAKVSTQTPDRGKQTYANDDICEPSSASSATQMSSGNADLKYTKFRISRIPGEKHAVFIPDTVALTVPVLTQICHALGKKMPSMLLSGVSSLCHPSKMSTPELRRCPAFKQLITEARSSLGLHDDLTMELAQEDVIFNGCCNVGSVSRDRECDLSGENTNKAVIEIANRVLEKNIASTISTISNAAYRTNIWTLTGPKISNFEIFLQQCIENGDTNVFRLVLGHVQDKAYMESELSKHLMRQLYEFSQVMSVNVVDQFQPICLQGDLWNPAKNLSHREFSEHGYDHWSFEKSDHVMYKGHPITLWPWPHGDLFFLFYREETITGTATSEVDWEYRTRQRLDQEAIPFSPDVLAPVAYTFIGGRDAMIRRTLLTSLKLAKPVVVLNNTPYIAKQVSLFMEILNRVWERTPAVSCRPFLADGAKLGGQSTVQETIRALEPSKILNYIDKQYDSSDMDVEDRLTLSDVVGLLDLAHRRSQAFRETICIVDPLVESQSSMISRLMTVFHSHQFGTREVASSATHHSLVLRAWRLHFKLARKERQLLRLATASTVAIGVAILLSTFLAVFMVHLHLQKDVTAYLPQMNVEIIFTPLETMCFMSICALVLPISAGILVALQSYFKLPQKWASVHMTSSHIVSEIYKFLGNVGPYMGDVAASQRRFEFGLRDVMDHLSSCGIREGNLLRGDDEADDLFKLEPGVLQEQINHSLYGVRPPGWLCRKAKLHAAFLRGLGADWPWTSLLVQGHEIRDSTALLTTESYVEMRMTPLRRYYREWLKSHSWLRMMLNLSFAVFLSVASVLGADRKSVV